MAADDATFKTAMRLLAGGVTIVATSCDGQVSGLTATAVCSLALSPPRVLACVNHAGVTYELISKSRIMSVNLLAEGQEDLAQRFAAKRASQTRSEEHTSELQSPCNLVCRLLLEKKKKILILSLFNKKTKTK